MSHLSLHVVLAPPVELLDVLGESLKIRNDELMTEGSWHQHDVGGHHAETRSRQHSRSPRQWDTVLTFWRTRGPVSASPESRSHFQTSCAWDASFHWAPWDEGRSYVDPYSAEPAWTRKISNKHAVKLSILFLGVYWYITATFKWNLFLVYNSTSRYF